MSETAIVRAILQALALEPGVVAYRNNSGARKGGKLRYGLGTGSADIICVVQPAGRFVALEVKVPNGTQHDEQLAWAASVQRHGGLYAVVHNVAEARQAVKEARR